MMSLLRSMLSWSRKQLNHNSPPVHQIHAYQYVSVILNKAIIRYLQLLLVILCNWEALLSVQDHQIWPVIITQAEKRSSNNVTPHTWAATESC